MTQDFHREFPQVPDAEKGVLCSLLLSPRDVADVCQTAGITADSFYIPAHQEIFRAVLDLLAENKPVEFGFVAERMRQAGTFDSAGGPAYLNELWVFLPTAASAAYYAALVLDKALARAVIKFSTEFAGRAYDPTEKIEALLEEFEAGALKVRPMKGGELFSARDGAREAVSEIERLYHNRGAITGVTTGLRVLDKMIDGLHPGSLTVIAGRPSMGKTALLMNMAAHAALDSKQSVGVFSLEMSRAELFMRMLCSEAHVNAAQVRNGFLSERSFPALMAGASRIASSQMWIDDSSALPIQELRVRARRMHKTKGITALFVDYLQLARSTTKKAEFSRQVEISEISGGLKALAKDLGIPVIVAAQLNRKPEERQGGVPRLSDLRESGSVEQDADVVGLLHREDYYAETPEEKEECAGRATLTIAKNRNGLTGQIALTFLKEFTKFQDRAECAEADQGALL